MHDGRPGHKGGRRMGSSRMRLALLAGLSVGVTALVLGGAAARADDDIVAQAKANVVRDSGPQDKWDGPTASVKPAPGKHIAFMSLDEQNDASRLWAQATQEAAAKVGWPVTVIDGRGSPKTWIEGINQAIALKVDG